MIEVVSPSGESDEGALTGRSAAIYQCGTTTDLPLATWSPSPPALNAVRAGLRVMTSAKITHRLSFHPHHHDYHHHHHHHQKGSFRLRSPLRVVPLHVTFPPPPSLCTLIPRPPDTVHYATPALLQRSTLCATHREPCPPPPGSRSQLSIERRWTTCSLVAQHLLLCQASPTATRMGRQGRHSGLPKVMVGQRSPQYS